MSDQETTDRFSHDAGILAQALPYMQRYEGKTVVVKYGGHAMGDLKLGQAFARDIALLKQSKVNPIVVHGGGPQIASMLAKLGIESKFEGGLRVTDARTMEVVEMVLAGSINKEIVALINAEGEWAIGLCGKDGNMVFAKKAVKTVKDPTSNIEKVLDLGFVGEPVEVDRTLLDLLAPLRDDPGHRAGGARPRRQYLQYQRRHLCRRHCRLARRQAPAVPDRRARRARQERQAHPGAFVREAKELIADGTISGGMIPKVETCLEALENGVEGVVILNGKSPHVVLVELFTEFGAGTLIVR